jgi:hypothetical protein
VPSRGTSSPCSGIPQDNGTTARFFCILRCTSNHGAIPRPARPARRSPALPPRAMPRRTIRGAREHRVAIPRQSAALVRPMQLGADPRYTVTTSPQLRVTTARPSRCTSLPPHCSPRAAPCSLHCTSPAPSTVSPRILQIPHHRVILIMIPTLVSPERSRSRLHRARPVPSLRIDGTDSAAPASPDHHRAHRARLVQSRDGARGASGHRAFALRSHRHRVGAGDARGRGDAAI